MSVAPTAAECGPAPARYFFSIRYGDRLLSDREGIEFAEEADVGRCARYLATQLRSDRALQGISLAGCAVEVTDRRGDHVLTAFVATA